MVEVMASIYMNFRVTQFSPLDKWVNYIRLSRNETQTSAVFKAPQEIPICSQVENYKVRALPSKLQPTDQPHQQHLGACETRRILGLTPDLLSQTLHFNGIPVNRVSLYRDLYAFYSLRSADWGHLTCFYSRESSFLCSQALSTIAMWPLYIL